MNSRAWRIQKFIMLRFPFFPVQTILFAGFLINYICIAHRFVHRPLVLMEMVFGGISFVLMNLQLRIFDDLKDGGTDREHFPERPLATGLVTRQDLKWLLFFLNSVLLACQIPFMHRSTFGIYVFIIIYSLLTFRWFFIEEVLKNNLILAFLTHHPLVFFFQIYLLSFFGLSSIPLSAWFFAIAVGLGGTVWELGRKIRGTSQETDYVTYSRVFGIKGAVFLWQATLITSVALALMTLMKGRSTALFLFPLGVVVVSVYRTLSFIFHSEVAPRLERWAEIYAFSLLFAILVAGIT